MSEHLGTQDFSGVKVLFDQYSLPPHANLKQLLSSFKLPYLAIQHHAHLKKNHLRYNYMSHNTEYELRKVHVFCLSEFCLFKEYRLFFFKLIVEKQLNLAD